MAIDMTGEMTLIDNALADGVPCLLGTADATGTPQISPKGSMMVFDAGRLAYWERSGRTALQNIGVNPQVVVYYRNPEKGVVWRFHGLAEVAAEGPERDQVFERMVPAEREKDPDGNGAAVLIRVHRITDLRGTVIQEA